MPPPREATGSLELLRRLTLAGVDLVVVGGVDATLHGSSLVTVERGGFRVRVLGLDALISAKRAVGRD